MLIVFMFGSWTSAIPALSEEFSSAFPFPHVVIENFFDEQTARGISGEFGEPNEDWHEYKNPLERKFAKNTGLGDHTTAMLNHMQSPEFVGMMSSISGIRDLTSDPYLHGAGIHAYPPGGKLDMHLDYSVHPISGMERRLNLLVFLTEDWTEDCGGDLILTTDIHASDDMLKKVSPRWNTAVLFRTTDDSIHGLPQPTTTSKFRKSLAIYYVSPPREGITQREKAQFFPWRQKVHDKLQRLYDLRPHRRIEEADLWEGWETDGKVSGKW
jgi:Rps23 Pro-64 3,4-dihydroxylase Tpa1-like proline 4-hydroxylase